MNKSFYHYMMKHRDGNLKNIMSQFSHILYEDHSFPKQSSNYDEISSYLELSGLLTSMTIFDEAWEQYIQGV
ncbi:YozE family protein [Microbacteriaceae bacterium 4G12]